MCPHVPYFYTTHLEPYYVESLLLRHTPRVQSTHRQYRWVRPRLFVTAFVFCVFMITIEISLQYITGIQILCFVCPSVVCEDWSAKRDLDHLVEAVTALWTRL